MRSRYRVARSHPSLEFNPSQTISLPSNYRKRMLDYVRWILGEMRADQDGDVSIDWSSGLDHRLRVIVSTIWPRLSHMAGGQDRLRAHTWKAFVAQKPKGIESVDWDEFSQAVVDQARLHESRPLTRYTVLFPLHLIGPWIEHKLWLNVLDLKIRRVTRRHVRVLPGWDGF